MVIDIVRMEKITLTEREEEEEEKIGEADDGGETDH